MAMKPSRSLIRLIKAKLLRCSGPERPLNIADSAPVVCGANLLLMSSPDSKPRRRRKAKTNVAARQLQRRLAERRALEPKRKKSKENSIGPAPGAGSEVFKSTESSLVENPLSVHL